jgi:hypothetical protein
MLSVFLIEKSSQYRQSRRQISKASPKKLLERGGNAPKGEIYMLHGEHLSSGKYTFFVHRL